MGHGFMMAPAVGKRLARAIATGETRRAVRRLGLPAIQGHKAALVLRVGRDWRSHDHRLTLFFSNATRYHEALQCGCFRLR